MLSVVSLGVICELGEGVGVGGVETVSGEEPDIAGAKPSVFPPSAPMKGKMLPGGYKSRTLSFSLEEFVDLSDGRRVTLKADRGFNKGGPIRLAVKVGKWRSVSLPFARSPRMMWWFITRAGLTREVMAVLEPDDEREWFDWIVDRLSSFGIEVDEASVVAAPFVVELGPIVESKLRK